MKTDRLLGETIYLLNHGRTSSQDLAVHFEVSARTIMRDMDTLCMAGIPVISNLGADGGYEIMDTFKMQQQIAKKNDYRYIVCALEGLASAYADKDIEAALDKMKTLTNNDSRSIVMDLSSAHENRDTNEMLYLLNHAVKTKHIVSFIYTNAGGGQKKIEAEPVYVIYKWYNWYMIGYSKKHDDYRMYKVVRMDDLSITDKENTKVHDVNEVNEIINESNDTRKYIRVKLKCKSNIKLQCREYFNGSIIEEYENGDFLYEFEVPEDEKFWYGMLLSFGKDAEVLEPIDLIERIKKNYVEIMELYK